MPTALKRVSLVLCTGLTSMGFQMQELSSMETVMTARGTFEVRVTPQAADDAGGPFSRVYLDKHYAGDLAGTSKGHMLGAETALPGSAGYVALELVTGTLHGRRGSFMLQHSGHMARGAMTMTATVIPDSGTDELAGLSGKLAIKIEGGKHFYELEYTVERR